jgi:hypothetical protein
MVLPYSIASTPERTESKGLGLSDEMQRIVGGK